MTGPDEEDFARLWRDDDGASEADTRMLAARARRRAIWSQRAENALSAALGFTLVLLIWSQPAPMAAILGGAILVLLGWSSWKRHRLGQIALLTGPSDRADYVHRALQAREAALGRSRLGLALFLPAMAAGMLFFHLRESGGVMAGFGDFLAARLAGPRGLAAALFVAVALAILISAHRRLRAARDALADASRQYADAD